MSDPPDPKSPLLTAPNVFLTPHIGGSSKENLLRIGDNVVETPEEVGEAGHPPRERSRRARDPLTSSPVASTSWAALAAAPFFRGLLLARIIKALLDENLYPEWTPEREIAEFQRLKGRMLEVWQAIGGNEGEAAYTSVVVPSLTLDQGELRKVAGAAFYEERLLFLLMRLRNPRARIVYVTSQPVHPLVLEYYLQLLAGIPASHARSRLTLLCAYDASGRSLTEKILERPRLIDRIRAGIHDPSRAFLTVFNSTPLERSSPSSSAFHSSAATRR